MRNDQVIGLPAWRLRKVLTFIDLNIDARISLPLLAKAAGLSRMHFARLFRLSTGLCPHEYVLRNRLERAKTLMIDSNDSIAAIGQASGFRSAAYFANVFHRRVGEAPSRWRRSMRTYPRDLRNDVPVGAALTHMELTLRIHHVSCRPVLAREHHTKVPSSFTTPRVNGL
jgi:AraC-like DNA-binding protein